MAYTNLLYGQMTLNAFKKLINDLNAAGTTVKCMLCTSTYAPSQDNHQCKSDVTNEITGTGYTAGGATLANKALVYTGATNIMNFDADDVSWASSTITARYAVIYDATPAADADKKLLCYIDFAADKSTENGTFTIQFDAAGIFKITVS